MSEQASHYRQRMSTAFASLSNSSTSASPQRPNRLPCRRASKQQLKRVLETALLTATEPLP